jgi:hypothetical protein
MAERRRETGKRRERTVRRGVDTEQQQQRPTRARRLLLRHRDAPVRLAGSLRARTVRHTTRQVSLALFAGVALLHQRGAAYLPRPPGLCLPRQDVRRHHGEPRCRLGSPARQSVHTKARGRHEGRQQAQDARSLLHRRRCRPASAPQALGLLEVQIKLRAESTTVRGRLAATSSSDQRVDLDVMTWTHFSPLDLRSQ